ncbi:ABC transporter permease [Pseudonocardia sp.]|jgi:ribose/xylose/arabinose/galactoside ABC-type transport system permease subunit|uniref:ABC transporter permease n=1 Tax=Pseudonocardia sp. TaxID=60912 RepID=UPI00261B5EF7|nr:ABC transporter permease [Pseudonocardia sp.]MCW2722429.1 putative sugar transport system, permease protein [Pseudonocardia sp.]MDT7618184.1 ribose transport system permease protein [Pseudonocardiales bacterium]
MGDAARYAAPIGLVVVFVAFFIATPDFLTVDNISDLLVSAAILLVLAMGQQLVVTVAGIDLSVGSNLPWAAAVLGFGYSHGWGLAVSILAAVLAGLLVGVVNGVLVARLNMTDFIVTLGSLSVVSGLTLLLTGGNTVPVNSSFLQGLALDGIGPLRWFWVVAALVALVVGFLLFRTRTGTYFLATGGNIDAARESGINVSRIRLLAYAGSGLACGLASVLLVARTGGADPSLQTDLLLSSIAAVVLGGSSLFGGHASVLGSAAGAVLLQSLINGFTLIGISQYYQPIAVGVVVLGAAFISRFQK